MASPKVASTTSQSLTPTNELPFETADRGNEPTEFDQEIRGWKRRAGSSPAVGILMYPTMLIFLPRC
jgi:hypothetical protein